MAPQWDLNLDGVEEGMIVTLVSAREWGHTRLFAMSEDRAKPVKWFHAPGEKSMQSFFDNCEESDDEQKKYCWTPVVVVDPRESDEAILALLKSRKVREGWGMGYFRELPAVSSEM